MLSLPLRQGCFIVNIYSNIQQRNDSRRFRRRMHAIPAAIALLLLGIVWLLSGHSAHAVTTKPVFSATDLNESHPPLHLGDESCFFTAAILTDQQGARSAVPIATNE